MPATQKGTQKSDFGSAADNIDRRYLDTVAYTVDSTESAIGKENEMVQKPFTDL